MKNASARFERLGAFMAVGYGKAIALAAAERGFDHVAEPRGVDHHVAETTGREALEVILDQTFAADAQQRLRFAIGERAHAFAAPRGEDHRLHLCFRFARRFGRAFTRVFLCTYFLLGATRRRTTRRF